MKIALVGPGIMPIPPTGWGAVEDLIWEIACELGERGHEGVIINTPDLNEIISEISLEQYDFVHLFYDVFYPVLDVIGEKFNNSVTAISSAYPYVDQFEYHRRDGYTGFFEWAVSQNNHYNFCLSDKDLNTFQSHGAQETKLKRLGLGAQHKKFLFKKTGDLQNKSLYLAKIEQRKKQWIYQSVPNIDFVGRYTPTTSFDKNNQNYIGEWTPGEKYSNMTNYANLILLSDGENGTPLVIKEALMSGLGIVCSKYAAYDLDLNLPFIDVISDDKLDDIDYIKTIIEENRQKSIECREDIRQYGIENFSWEIIVEKYENDILSLV